MIARTERTPPRGLLARYGWPLGIVLILALGAGFNIAVMLVARHDPAFAIEPNYYQRAVRWDEEMEQERMNRVLGWHARGALSLAASRDSTGRLEVALANANGAPIANATVTAEVMHNARAADRRAVALRESEPGVYVAALEASRPGEWEVRLRVTRGTARFTHHLRLTAAAR